jgi:hypothetical protein
MKILICPNCGIDPVNIHVVKNTKSVDWNVLINDWLIKELDSDYIYELQNIPVWRNGVKTVTKYFDVYELDYFLDKNKKDHPDYDNANILMATAIDIMKEVIKDIDSKRLRAICLGDDLKKVKIKNAYTRMIKDYEELLIERI